MKVEWLNEDCTLAKVVVGWRRQRWSIVRRDEWNTWDSWGVTWVHQSTGRDSGLSSFWMDWRRNHELGRRVCERDEPKEWQPLGTLPEAKVVSK